MSHVIVIPDLQAPFQHPQALEFLVAVRDTYECKVAVCIGDEIDFHAISDYTADPDGYSPGQEMDKALEFMAEVYDEFPDVMVCESNHTSRPFRKAYRYGLPRRFIRDYAEFLEAPEGWEWRHKWKIDGVVYEHGEQFGGEFAHMRHAKANMRSTVIGHHHANFGVQWTANSDQLVFGMAVGCLVDRHAYAFRYGKNSPRKEVLGCGVVIDGVQPLAIPMLLDSRGNWTGKIP